MRLQRCINIEDLRAMARSRLPGPIFQYLEGGSDDEWSLQHNRDAFLGYQLQPLTLRDVASVSLETDVLGCRLGMPLILSPTGMSRLFHHDKELAVARAAAASGALYSLSTVATSSIEEVAAAAEGPKMFQVYIFRDRGLTEELLERCRSARYTALCLTVDTPVAGNRERDRRSGMVVPPRLSVGGLLSFARHPAWIWHYLRDPEFSLVNVAHRVVTDPSQKPAGVIEYVNSQFDRGVTWQDAAWLARRWDGPFVLKGIQTPDDAKRALDIGARALMISNHGGRQLDCSAAPVDCVAPIRNAVGDDMQLIVDGGIRRGTDILKALALGANACSIGRPYLYGLAAGGQAGVERALAIFREELARDMALLGCRTIREVSGMHVQPGQYPSRPGSAISGLALRRRLG